MKIPSLREFTSARVALGRTGEALPTREHLALQLAHARAREAVHAKLDAERIAREMEHFALDVVRTHSAADNRATYLHRPDLGRALDENSRALLVAMKGDFDAVFVAADGLSAIAVEHHAAAALTAVWRLLERAEWQLAPLVIVEQGRVAIGDEIGECLGAALSIVLIGERPGLSSPDSLGIYLTWHPRPGLTDADRNCISNVRTDGLSYAAAAHRLVFLMNEARRRKLSGVALKEDAKAIEA